MGYTDKEEDMLEKIAEQMKKLKEAKRQITDKNKFAVFYKQLRKDTISIARGGGRDVEKKEKMAEYLEGVASSLREAIATERGE